MLGRVSKVRQEPLRRRWPCAVVRNHPTMSPKILGSILQFDVEEEQEQEVSEHQCSYPAVVEKGLNPHSP